MVTPFNRNETKKKQIEKKREEKKKTVKILRNTIHKEMGMLMKLLSKMDCDKKVSLYSNID